MRSAPRSIVFALVAVAGLTLAACESPTGPTGSNAFTIPAPHVDPIVPAPLVYPKTSR